LIKKIKDTNAELTKIYKILGIKDFLFEYEYDPSIEDPDSFF